MEMATVLIVGALLVAASFWLGWRWSRRRQMEVLRSNTRHYVLRGDRLRDLWTGSLRTQTELRKEIDKLNGMVLDEQRKNMDLLKHLPARDAHGKFAAHDDTVEEAYRHAL